MYILVGIWGSLYEESHLLALTEFRQGLARERLLQYIRDLSRCMSNSKLGAGSGRLALANIRDHCTSGVTPKADVQNFSFNFRKVLKVAV